MQENTRSRSDHHDAAPALPVRLLTEFADSLRTTVNADHVRILPACADKDLPPSDTTHLDVGRDDDAWGTVEIRRDGRPLDEAERALVSPLLSLLAAALEDQSATTLAHRRMSEFVEHTFEALDLLRNGSVEERLTLVARSATELLGATGWSIGRFEDHVVVARASSSDHRRFPALWAGDRVLEGGSIIVGSRDQHSPAASQLRRDEFDAALAAGGYDVDAERWLVCIFDDGLGLDLHLARTAVTAVVQAALSVSGSLIPDPGSTAH